MSHAVHPRDALFSAEKPFPVLAAAEHFAGSEKLILKALSLQDELGPVFDITCDCEDGAKAGEEEAHARMVGRLIGSAQNKHRKLGVRIHDPSHPAWKQDVDIVVGAAAAELAYVTVPKATSAAQVREVIDYVQKVAQATGRETRLPIHVLIETHGALREVFAIAELPHIEVLDFGLMDFVSGHHGAIPAAAMRSPGQFAPAARACQVRGRGRGTGPRHRAGAQRLSESEGRRRDPCGRPTRARRVRLPAHVEHLPRPDHAHRLGHAARLRGSG